MKGEFLEIHEKLFNDSYNLLRRSLTLKLKAMNLCAERQNKQIANSSYQSCESGENKSEDLTKSLKLNPSENASIKA